MRVRAARLESGSRCWRQAGLFVVQTDGRADDSAAKVLSRRKSRQRQVRPGQAGSRQTLPCSRPSVEAEAWPLPASITLSWPL